jgi:hypothetical protein
LTINRKVFIQYPCMFNSVKTFIQDVAPSVNPNFQINYDEKKIVGRGLLNQARDIAITNIINLVYLIGGVFLFIFLIQILISKDNNKASSFVKKAIPIITLIAIAYILSTPIFNTVVGYAFREISGLLNNIKL